MYARLQNTRFSGEDKSEKNVNESLKKVLNYVEKLGGKFERETEFLRGLDYLLVEIFGASVLSPNREENSSLLQNVSKKNKSGTCWFLIGCQRFDTRQLLCEFLDPYGGFFQLLLKYADPFYTYVMKLRKSMLPYADNVGDRKPTSLYCPSYLSGKTLVNKMTGESYIEVDVFDYFFLLFARFVIDTKYPFEVGFAGDALETLLSPLRFFQKVLSGSGDSRSSSRKRGRKEKLVPRRVSFEDPYRRLLQRYLDFFFGVEFEERTSARRTEDQKNPQDVHGVNFFSELRDKFLNILIDYWMVKVIAVDDEDEDEEVDDGDQKVKVDFAPFFQNNPGGILVAGRVLLAHVLKLPGLVENCQKLVSRLSRFNTNLTGLGRQSVVSPVSIDKLLPTDVDYMQVPVYHLINSLLQHFPSVSHLPFPETVGLWVTAVKPWDQFKRGKWDKLWLGYVLANFPFYTTVFGWFLRVFSKMFCEKRAPKEWIGAVHCVVTVVADRGLLGVLKRIDDHLLLEQGKIESKRVGKKDELELLLETGLVQESLQRLQGSLETYKSVFRTRNMTALARKLCTECKKCEAMYSRRKSTRKDTARTNVSFLGKKIPLRRMINEIHDRIVEIFKIPENTLREDFKRNRPSTDHVSSATPEKMDFSEQSSPPHWLKMKMVSPHGKYQLFSGMATCEKKSCAYLGDDLDFPVHSAEVSFLVGPLVETSQFINRICGVRNGKISVLGLQLPRLNLRPLAGKSFLKAIFFFFLFTFIFKWFFSI